LRENKQNEQIDYLSLKTEVEQADVDPEEEFKDCFKGLKTLVIRERLDNISKEIKKAEQEKNSEKVQELIQQFNQCSKSRSDLEISEI